MLRRSNVAKCKIANKYIIKYWIHYEIQVTFKIIVFTLESFDTQHYVLQSNYLYADVNNIV